MSRTRKLIVVTAGAAAGLFLGSLATSVTAAADTATNPVPGLPGLVEQFVSSPGSIPQQILQTTTSALGGAAAAPATPPPLANASVTLPQSSLPTAGAPMAPTTPSGLANLPNDLSRMFPFPMPNLGTTPAVPAATAPSVLAPSVVAPPATLALPQVIEPAMRFPVSALP